MELPVSTMNYEFSPQALPPQQQPAPIAFNFSRRYACDRCRGQKLRCNRDLMSLSNSPCLRCRRAKAECTIASSPTRRDAGSAHNSARRGRRSTIGSGDLSSTATTQSINSDQLKLTKETPLPSIQNINIPSIISQASPPWNTAPDSNTLDNIPSMDDVSWQDIFCSTFDQPADESFRNSAEAAGLPTPISPNNPSVSNVSTNQTSKVSTDLSVSREQSNNSSKRALTQSILLQGDGGSTTAVTPSHAYARLAATMTPGLAENVPDIHEPRPNSLEGNDRADDNLSNFEQDEDLIQPTGSSMATVKDRNIDMLSNLSATLMKDLHRITTLEGASSFLREHSDTTAAEYFFKTMDSATSVDYIIGKMLHGTEKFLEVLHSLNKPSIPGCCKDTGILGASTRDKNQELAGCVDAKDPSETDLEARMDERWRFIQAILDRANLDANNDSARVQSFADGQIKRGPQPKSDMPLTFALVTCYKSVIKIYESVFSIILHSFEVSHKWTSSNKFPQTITGFQINDFVLQNHRDLQIKILIQISTHMLDCMEKELGEEFAEPLFQALLKTSLQQEGHGSLSHNETGTRIVRDMMKKMEEQLLSANP